MWKICSWKIETDESTKSQTKQNVTKFNSEIQKKKAERKFQEFKTLLAKAQNSLGNEKMFKLDFNFKVKK